MPELFDLLDVLSKSRRTLEEDKHAIISALNERDRGIIEGKDFQRALESFKAWLLALVREETIPGSIQGLCFGLHEPEGSFGLYLTGAYSYDPEDSDWACANDYWPEGRYCRLEILKTIQDEPFDGDTEPWQVAQAISMAIIKAFFQQHAEEFLSASGLQRVHVATGFDDGDLYEVVTPITPNS